MFEDMSGKNNIIVNLIGGFYNNLVKKGRYVDQQIAFLIDDQRRKWRKLSLLEGIELSLREEVITLQEMKPELIDEEVSKKVGEAQEQLHWMLDQLRSKI
jgi:hypothetical protein